MKVEINLDAPYSCKGCPLAHGNDFADWCELGYWHTKDGCPKERPRECIDRNGL